MSVLEETKPGGSISALYVHCVGHTDQFCHIFLLKGSGKLYSLWSYLCVCVSICICRSEVIQRELVLSSMWFSGIELRSQDGSMCSYPISISGLEKEAFSPQALGSKDSIGRVTGRYAHCLWVQSVIMGYSCLRKWLKWSEPTNLKQYLSPETLLSWRSVKKQHFLII